MTLLDFLRLTRANILVLVGGIILGAALGFGYAAMQPKVYTATASGYVAIGGNNGSKQTNGNTNSDGAVDVGSILSGDSAAQAKAQAYLPLVTSSQAAAKIKKDSGLDLSESQIQSSLSAEVAPNSTLINVTANADSPEHAVTLANSSLKATAQVAGDLEANRSTIRVVPLDNAQEPGAPSSPNVKKFVLAGAVAGLVLAYLIALLRKFADVKVRTTQDLEKATDVGILGILPKAESLDENTFLEDKADHQSEEALRQLRTNLRFVSVDNPPRSFIVTSPNPGEGKSTVSASLAHAFAKSGQPTLLIDADLRRPTGAKIFGIDNTVGLSQVLSGQVSVEEAIQHVGESNLFVIPAGRIPPNPSELLGSARMQQLIKELEQEYLVIIDVPPLLPVTDGSLLSTSVDGAILVTSCGATRKDQVEAAADMIRRVKGRLLGTVLNKAPEKGVGSQFYGFGYGGYRSGYQAYYGEDGKRIRGRSKSKGSAKA